MTDRQLAIETFKKFIPPKGLSTREQEEFRRRIKEDYEILNRDRYKNYKYDFMQKFEEIGITRDQIPDFMYAVLKTQFLLKTEAERFIEDFCIDYLEDLDFRNALLGKWIIIEDGYFRIDDNLSSLDFDSDTKKFISKIGIVNPANGYGASINKLRIEEIQRHIDDHQFTEIRPKSFTVNCGMGLEPDTENMTCKIKIFDTGLEISHLIDDSCWDYQDNEFLDKNFSRQFIKCCTDQTMYTCNGPVLELLVFLKFPMYISVEGLKPVMINSFLVPFEKPENELNLIGMDILYQYSWCYGNYDDEDQLIIKEKRKLNFSFNI